MDTYHPVVDYANVFVVGITAAMAWELPNKPVYLEQELQDAYKNGEFLLIDRSDNNVTEDQKITTTKKPSSSKNTKKTGLDSYYNQPDRYYTKDRYYANSNYYYKQPWSMGQKKSNKFYYYFPYGNSLADSLNDMSKMKYDGRDHSWANNNWRRKDMTENV